MALQWIYAVIFTTILLAVALVWQRLTFLCLARSNNDLKSHVADLKRQLEYDSRVKAKMTMMIAHDLQSPLHFLAVLSDHVSRFADNAQFEEVKAGTEEIKRATGNIHAFVKEINLWTRSQHEHFHVSKHTFPFEAIAFELEQFFGEMLLLNHNLLVVRYPENAWIYTNRDILKAILRNLLDNANKHTRGGQISLILEDDGAGSFTATVSDNGNGMLTSDLQRITRRIAHPEASTSVEPNCKLGYQIIIDFAHTLGYILDVASSRNSGNRSSGTTVRISGIIRGEEQVFNVQSAEIVGVGEPD